MFLHYFPHWINFSVSTVFTEVREYYPDISACNSEINATFNSSTCPAALTHGRIRRTVCDLTYHMLWNSKAAYMWQEVLLALWHFRVLCWAKKEAAFRFFMFLKLNFTLLIAIKPQKLKKQLFFFFPDSILTPTPKNCMKRFSGTCGFRQTHQTVLVSSIFVHNIKCLLLVFWSVAWKTSKFGPI